MISSVALTEISKSGLPKPNKVAIFYRDGGDLKEKMNKKENCGNFGNFRNF